MNYSSEDLSIVAIPQWKECYLDYEVLRIFLVIIKEAALAVAYCEKVMAHLQIKDSMNDGESEGLFPSYMSDLYKIQDQLMEIINEQNRIFYKMYICQVGIVELFYQMKVLQLQRRIRTCQFIKSHQFDKKLTPVILTLFQYVYIEVHYLSEMREVNLKANQKILRNHKTISQLYVQTPQSSFDKIDRMSTVQSKYQQIIQNYYIEINKGKIDSKEAKKVLKTASHSAEVDEMDYFLTGLGVGATCILIGTLIFIIKIQNLNIQNRTEAFGRDFPTWRGIALFIFYIWILAFDLYYFQKYKISHRLIFKIQDHHHTTSSQIFKVAGFFTTIFMVVFLIYLLMQTGIIKHQPLFPTEYFVIIVWSSMVFYFFLPLKIFNHQGRSFALKYILKSFIAPVLPLQFTLNWVTDQWISMITPLRDFFYTVCYYQNLDFNNVRYNPCKDKSSFTYTALPIVLVFSYKVILSIRMGLKEGNFCMGLQMFNTLKHLSSILTAVLAFYYNQGLPNLLGIWIISSMISTLYNYYWDLKFDWQLLEPKCKNWRLRKYLTLQPKFIYYIIICANLIMRFSWSITLSPTVQAYFGSPALLTLVTGSIEIVRRGIWNLLRIETQQIKNANEFRAVPDMTYLEQKLKIDFDEFNERQNVKQEISNQKDHIKLLKKKIQQSQTAQKQFNQEYSRKKLDSIINLKKDIRKIKIEAQIQ